MDTSTITLAAIAGDLNEFVQISARESRIGTLTDTRPDPDIARKAHRSMCWQMKQLRRDATFYQPPLSIRSEITEEGAAWTLLEQVNIKKSCPTSHVWLVAEFRLSHWLYVPDQEPELKGELFIEVRRDHNGHGQSTDELAQTILRELSVKIKS